MDWFWDDHNRCWVHMRNVEKIVVKSENAFGSLILFHMVSGEVFDTRLGRQDTDTLYAVMRGGYQESNKF